LFAPGTNTALATFVHATPVAGSLVTFLTVKEDLVPAFAAKKICFVPPSTSRDVGSPAVEVPFLLSSLICPAVMAAGFANAVAADFQPQNGL
jgi:hypothetical protein